MNPNRQVGIFWGSNALNVVESENTKLLKSFNIVFSEEDKKTFKHSKIAGGNLQFTSRLHQTFQKENINTPNINLSLPIKDIIFRSFVIPWMHPNEVKNAVDFEAGKYIPFGLEELSYAFYPINITEGGNRKLRIIFVAIKKDALDYYANIFQHAGIQLNIVEPAPISLIRALAFKQIISKDLTITIVEKENDLGRITILNQYITHFVREFPITPVDTTTGDSVQIESKRLLNEIKISLDYFNRQDSQLQVKQILLLCEKQSAELANNLKEEMQIKVVSLDCASILSNDASPEIGFINSFGASLINTPESLPVIFDLSRKKKDSKPSAGSSESSLKQILNLKLLAIPVAISLALLTGTFFLSSQLNKKVKNDLNSLTQTLGSMKDVAIESITQNNDLIKQKITVINNFSTHSNVNLFLNRIPELLSQGTWIKNLDIIYADIDISQSTLDVAAASGMNTPVKNNLIINITGYAYHENVEDQFKLINGFLSNLKKENLFSKQFERIDIDSVRAERIDDFKVTSFRITCK